MPTPTLRSRLTLARLAKHGGLRKVPRVDYSDKKIEKQPQQVRRAATDKEAKRTVVDLYKRKLAASPKPFRVDSAEGKIACRDIATIVFPGKQGDRYKKHAAV